MPKSKKAAEAAKAERMAGLRRKLTEALQKALSDFNAANPDMTFGELAEIDDVAIMRFVRNPYGRG